MSRACETGACWWSPAGAQPWSGARKGQSSPDDWLVVSSRSGWLVPWGVPLGVAIACRRQEPGVLDDLLRAFRRDQPR